MNIGGIAALRLSEHLAGLQSIGAQLEATTAPLRELSRRHEDFMRGIAIPMTNLQVATSMAEACKPLLEQLRLSNYNVTAFQGPQISRLTNQIASLNQQMQQLSLAFPAGTQLLNMKWAESVGLLEPLKLLGDDFLVELGREMDARLIEHGDIPLASHTQASLEDLLVDLRTGRVNASPAAVNTSFALQAIIALILSLLSSQIPNILEQRDGQRNREALAEVLSRVEEHQKRLITYFEGLRESALPHYVIQGAAPVRVAPHGKAPRTATVPECSIAETVQVMGTWHEVVYLDNADGAQRRGWVHRRWLRQLDLGSAETCTDSTEP